MSDFPYAYYVAFSALRKEIERAREKFPDSRMLIDALGEELGEAARCPEIARGSVEWLHVACVAMRLYVEHTPDDTTAVLALFEAAELIARENLDAFEAGRGGSYV
jgi:hypothetical protein